MANLQYTVVTRVFSQSYGAYHKRDTLELLRRNPRLTLLPLKRWPICKILSLNAITNQREANLKILLHAPKSLSLGSLTVLITRATFWNSHDEMLT